MAASIFTGPFMPSYRSPAGNVRYSFEGLRHYCQNLPGHLRAKDVLELRFFTEDMSKQRSICMSKSIERNPIPTNGMKPPGLISGRAVPEAYVCEYPKRVCVGLYVDLRCSSDSLCCSVGLYMHANAER